MKPFDLEAAKAGKKVITRDGKAVRIVCFDLKREAFPILALVCNGSKGASPEDAGTEECVHTYTKKGAFRLRGESSVDLFMAPETVVKWANIYPDGTANLHDSKENADSERSPYHDRVACIRIEYEI